MRNSFGAVRPLDRKAFIVTSGPHHIGAGNANSPSTEHILTAADRAILQGYEEEDLPRFLASPSETAARKMVADVIPPPFAKKMEQGGYPHLRSKLTAHKLKPRLKMLEKTDHACTYVMLRKSVTLNASAKWRHKSRSASSPNYKSAGDEPPSPLQCAAARQPMMALLLGATEAHHEASSQLARASEVTWKWSVISLLQVFRADAESPCMLNTLLRSVITHSVHAGPTPSGRVWSGALP